MSRLVQKDRSIRGCFDGLCSAPAPEMRLDGPNSAPTTLRNRCAVHFDDGWFRRRASRDRRATSSCVPVLSDVSTRPFVGAAIEPAPATAQSRLSPPFCPRERRARRRARFSLHGLCRARYDDQHGFFERERLLERVDRHLDGRTADSCCVPEMTRPANTLHAVAARALRGVHPGAIRQNAHVDDFSDETVEPSSPLSTASTCPFSRSTRSWQIHAPLSSTIRRELWCLHGSSIGTCSPRLVIPTSSFRSSATMRRYGAPRRCRGAWSKIRHGEFLTLRQGIPARHRHNKRTSEDPSRVLCDGDPPEDSSLNRMSTS